VQHPAARSSSSVAQLHGMEGGRAAIFEERRAFVRAAGPWLVLAPLIFAYSLAQGWKYIAAAPARFRPGMIANALIGPMFLAGIVLAIFVAMLVGRRHYHRHVRPLTSRGPFRICQFCSTHNLVTPAHQPRRA
jgi:hypothetical protein